MLKTLLKPTFPKVAVLTILLCGVLMFKYKSPAKYRVAARPKVPKVLPVPIQPAKPALQTPAEKKAEENTTALQTIPAPIVEEAPKTPAAKIAVVAKQKVIAKVKRVPHRKPIIIKNPEISDSLFEVGDGDQTEFVTPLDALAIQGFSENGETNGFDSNVMLSSLQVDESILTNVPPLEERFLVKEGELQENDFGELRQGLEPLQSEKLVLTASPLAKPMVITQATAEVKPIKPLLVASASVETAEKKEAEPIIAEPNPSKVEQAPDSEEPVDQDLIEEEPIIVHNQRIPLTPTAKVSPVETVKETVTTQTTVVPSLQPMTATIGGGSSVTTQVVPTLVIPEKKNDPKKMDQKKQDQNKTPTHNAFERTNTPSDDDTDPGPFKGRLLIDQGLQNWLNVKGGHIQLYLHRDGSKDLQDTMFIDYEQGEEEFEFDSEGMEGKYRLYAAIYSSHETAKIAQIQYPKVISTANYRETILFDLKLSDLQRNRYSESVQTTAAALSLSVTVFQGAPGNYRKSDPVSSASVTVIGHPEMKTGLSDGEGNVRIKNVPSKSELLLEVSAPGYYPTRQIVPVFDSNAYAAVYLLAKDKVESVTKFFTKKEQKDQKSVLMGRVYNPKTRAPLKDEELSLSFRRGGALYFDALPNTGLKSTSGTGMYGFFNVAPSVRTVQRKGSKHAALLSMLPGFGYYLELGRGGAKQLLGHLVDPFLNKGVPSKISILGDEANAVVTGDNGGFALSGIDLPPGIITLEVQAENYPTTWQTVAWNTREAERSRNLFMLESEMITESQKVNRVRTEKSVGTIVGGAEPSFFEKGRKCVGIQLRDSNGAEMSKEMGPYPIAGAKNGKKGFCLTPQAPGFAFFNIPSGEYIVNWVDEKQNTFRTHVIRVGINRTSVLVN